MCYDYTTLPLLCDLCTDGLCFSCTGGQRSLIAIPLAISAYFIILGICIISFSDKYLEYLTLFTITCQQVLVAGEGIYIRFSSGWRIVYDYFRILRLD